MNKILSNRLRAAFAAVVSFAAVTSVVSAFGDALPVIENGGTYINGLIAASAANSTITIPKGHYILDCPVVFDKGGSVLRGETDDPRDTVLDGNGQPNNVYVKGWALNKRLQNVTVTNVVWVNDAAVALEQGGVRLEYTMISNCVVSGCRVEASQGWNRGGGIYSQGGKIVKTRVDHCGLCGTASTVGSLEGGGIHMQGTSRVADCEIIANTVTVAVNAAKGFGGGIYATGGTITNCLIKDNVAVHIGGGLYASKIDVYATSVLSNRLTYSGWGGGVYTERASLAKCRIEGNVSANAAGVDLNGSEGYQVRDCLIRGNVASANATAGGVHSRATGTEGVISNCVFEVNTNTAYTSAFHLANGTTPNTVLLRDCWFLKNYGSYTAVSVDKILKDVQVRNCLFARNQFSGTDCGFTPTDGHVLIESCSFLEGENAQNGRCLDFYANWFSGDAQKACAEKVTILNTCVAGTTNGKDYPTWFKSLSVTNCTYCYERTGTAIPFGDDTHNVSGPIEDLQFADYANGNYAIGKKSILKDAGLTAAWMGDGSKKGVKDMGDGSYTVTKVMDYGVTISANNAHPRCKGDAVDIGCAEYKPTNGFILEVR